jgi:D-alanyl-D-alanine carboxypeptidase
MMTRKARALGMKRTVYRNASGLPDSAQVTTARDQAILGRAIQEHFPRYYKYFSTRTFNYRGQTIANHNRLLGRIEGVDGIKTGYIRASGFNLVTSVHRDRRYVVAVVLGGKSAAARDARMRQLIGSHIREAAIKRTAPMVARTPAKPEPRNAGRFALASAGSTPVARSTTVSRPRATPSAGSTEPIRPVPVRTLSVKPGKTTRTASVAPLHLPSAPPPAPESSPPTTITAHPPAPAVTRAGILGVLPARASTASLGEAAPPPAPAVMQAKTRVRSGWIIQVGAYPAESEAKERLSAVRSKASRLLAAADPFTEPVQRGETTLYRARFAGLDKEQAQAACKFLKRNSVDCLAIKN